MSESNDNDDDEIILKNWVLNNPFPLFFVSRARVLPNDLIS